MMPQNIDMLRNILIGFPLLVHIFRSLAITKLLDPSPCMTSAECVAGITPPAALCQACSPSPTSPLAIPISLQYLRGHAVSTFPSSGLTTTTLVRIISLQFVSSLCIFSALKTTFNSYIINKPGVLSQTGDFEGVGTVFLYTRGDHKVREHLGADGPLDHLVELEVQM